MKNKNKFYAVAVGQVPGIYEKWSGSSGAEAQVKGFPGARYKGFASIAEAETWLKEYDITGSISRPKEPANPKKKSPENNFLLNEELKKSKIIVYTDGGCIDNPGPGGYGAVVFSGDKRYELSGGFRRTTNNRMELTACIEALKSLDYPGPVILYSDSSYVVNGIMKGWAERWRKKGWMRTKDEPAENADLWLRLLDLCSARQVEFSWVRGHAGTPENERCDKLAKAAALSKDNVTPDTAFEKGKTKVAISKGLFD
jgi:ribonuclease HI